MIKLLDLVSKNTYTTFTGHQFTDNRLIKQLKANQSQPIPDNDSTNNIFERMKKDKVRYLIREQVKINSAPLKQVWQTLNHFEAQSHKGDGNIILQLGSEEARFLYKITALLYYGLGMQLSRVDDV